MELQEKQGPGGTEVAKAAGVKTPEDYGDARKEYEALRLGCGVYKLDARTRFALSGSDRTRWLNGMITNNVRDLQPGHGVYAFLLNPQGRILGDMNAFNDGERIVIDTDARQREKILATFDHYIIMDDVEVVPDLAMQTFGIAGPKAKAALGKMGIAPPELAPLQFVGQPWQEEHLRLVRDGDERREAYELWAAPNAVEKVWKALNEVGQPVGSAALEMDRIVRGVPRYGVDLRERDLPQETGQERALSFNKGCYVGQEIVERIRSRGNVHRAFVGFRVQGAVPAAGTKIEAAGKEVGEITSATTVPHAGRDVPIALGYVRRDAVAAQKDVLIGGVATTVSDLPFSDLLQG
jgi:folate-binding protein YgfZ